MITQISCKLTNALLVYAERQGLSISALAESFDGPEEFLRDPYFWIDLGQAEKFLNKAARVLGDPTIGYTVGCHAHEIHAFGALDNVFKMMTSQKDYYTNLQRFFSYFLAPPAQLQEPHFKELEHGDSHMRFRFPFSGIDFPQLFGFLRGVLENLPRYRGHPASHTDWDPKRNEMFITWESAQPSLFDIEPSQVVNPRLVQTLSAQLEATERALQGKNREVLAMRTELDQLRVELQTQLREKIYAEKMTGLAQLAAGVAHEINNPLSYVVSNLGRFEDYFLRLRTYIQHLETHMPQTEVSTRLADDVRSRLDIDFIFDETPSMLREAGEGLKRVKEIVKDLSSLAHPQSGRPENKLAMDLNGLLESSLKVFQDELGPQIKVEKQYKLNHPVKVFPVRMSQVFMNLISNAVHAITREGVIRIATSEKGSSAIVEIADDGMGMDESVMTRIFTPFFTTKAVGKGTGLGLSIAQSIVEMHKGQIDVKSEKGKGSRFTITLPLSDDINMNDGAAHNA